MEPRATTSGVREDGEPSVARLSATAHVTLREELTAKEVQEHEERLIEREERFTGLLNAIGFSTPEELEEFIYLHGAGKVVPTAPTALPTVETQTQLLVSPRKRDARNQKRKDDLASALDELARKGLEVEYAKEQQQKEKERAEDAIKDVERLTREMEELLDARRGEEEGTFTDEQVASCFDELDRLDAEVVELQSIADELRKSREEEELARRDAESRVWMLQTEVALLRSEVAKEGGVRGLKQPGSSSRTRPATPRAVAALQGPSASSPRPSPLRPRPPSHLTTASAASSAAAHQPVGSVPPASALPNPATTTPAPPSPSVDMAPSHPIQFPPSSANSGVVAAHSGISATVAVQSSAPPSVPRPTVTEAQQAHSQKVHRRYYVPLRESYEDIRDQLARYQDWIRTMGAPFMERKNAQARSSSTAPTGEPLPAPPIIIDISALPNFPACDTSTLSDDTLRMLYASLLEKRTELQRALVVARDWRELVKSRFKGVSSTEKARTQRARTGSSLAGSPMVRRDRAGEGKASSPRKVALAKGMLSPKKVRRPSSPKKSPSPSKRSSPAKNPFSAIVGHVETDQNDFIPPDFVPATPQKKGRKSDIFSAVLSTVRPAERVEMDARKVEPTPKTRAAPASSPEEPVTEDEEEMDVDIVVSPLRYSNAQQSPRKMLLGRGGSRSRSRSPEKSQGGRRASVGAGSLPIPSRTEEDIFAPIAPPGYQLSHAAHARLLAEAEATHEESYPQPSSTPKLASPGPSSPPSVSHSSPPEDLPLPRPSQRPRSAPNALAGSSRPRADAPSSALATRHSLQKSSVARSGSKRKDSPLVVKEEEEGSLEPVRNELRHYARLGTPPSPKTDWERVRRREEKMKEKREGGTKKKRRKGESAKDGKRERRRREEESEEERPKKRKRKKELEEEEESEEEEKRSRKKKKGKGKEKALKEELDEEALEAAIAKGPAEGDPNGLAYMRKIHAKRRLGVERKKAAKAAQNATDRREVEINPERNDGRTDHFHDVVRNKDARQQMHADCCDGCAEYYKRAMGPENPIAENHENHFLEDRHKQMEARLQKTSRHRRQHRAEPDPPDYWQMGFPPTQKVEEINLRAVAQREETRKYREAEAMQEGRYRWRGN